MGTGGAGETATCVVGACPVSTLEPGRKTRFLLKFLWHASWQMEIQEPNLMFTEQVMKGDFGAERW